MMSKMTRAVINRLANYVYRLIDPRDGETFYVGVGKGSRVLDHVKGELNSHKAIDLEVNESDYEDEADLKLLRIKKIRQAGLEVIHVIHRHGIEDPKVARVVEAALIDAYPGLSNRATGHKSADFGCRNLLEIIKDEEREEFTLLEPAILISIGRSFEADPETVYENTRYAWRANLERARQYNLIISHSVGVVTGVFRPTEWLYATRSNFPNISEEIPKRIGFNGVDAERETLNNYLGRRVPDQFRQRGAANPFRYIDVDGTQSGKMPK